MMTIDNNHDVVDVDFDGDTDDILAINSSMLISHLNYYYSSSFYFILFPIELNF
jgi:hypothetical protein